MTKQEQIENITKIIDDEYWFCICGPSCMECELRGNEPYPDCMTVRQANAIYNAGYKLADEVRKETLQEVVDTIRK